MKKIRKNIKFNVVKQRLYIHKNKEFYFLLYHNRFIFIINRPKNLVV